MLVLAASDAPFGHGELPWWPPWGPWFARPAHRVSALWRRMWTANSLGRAERMGESEQGDGTPSSSRDWTSVFVIPEDVYRKDLMADHVSRWCSVEPQQHAAEWTWCGGPPLSYFQDEYAYAHELFPPRWIRWYDVDLPIPNEPWAMLNRTYGRECGFVARMNEHGDAGPFDLRLPEHAHLRRPAAVDTRAAMF